VIPRLLYGALLVAGAVHGNTSDKADPSAISLSSREFCGEIKAVQIKVDRGHPWRPPYGLERVGAPLAVHIELSAEKTALQRKYYVTAYKNGRKVERHALSIQGDGSNFFGRVQLAGTPDTVELSAQCLDNTATQLLARQEIDVPQIEAEAIARPIELINPIDLGTVLVPNDWLLLAGGQSAIIDVAALSRDNSLPHARVRASFEGGKAIETDIALTQGRRAVANLQLPLVAGGDITTLSIAILNGSRELWRKNIRTMVVGSPPSLPRFGGIETKLRYDAPIALGHEKDGQSRDTLDYKRAWDPRFNDVVVSLPNGTRFVFWRGASYIPFWASPYNIGLTYQWAEGLHLQAPNAEGGFEMPEAINDKELRYSTVKILESTAARVHVRWAYQATDIAYRTWGDQPVEDYYFYPDGFGTRVVTLTAAPEAQYELSEFISLTPQGTFPLRVLPKKIVEMLYLNGDSRSFTLPLGRDSDEAESRLATIRRGPAVYRVYQHQDDQVPAIYFSPTNPPPAMGFGPFYDGGEMVTPAYWGDHWPLSREKLTRYYIHSGIFTGPAHNSFMGWTRYESNNWVEGNPEPITISRTITIDSQGSAKQMTTRRWAWLIGKIAASDDELRAWGQSFSSPPSVTLKGARLDVPAYVQERRAIRLVAQSSSIEIKLKPMSYTVNPVFELESAPKIIAGVMVDGKKLPKDDYAWDGATLWMKAKIDRNGANLTLNFR
jgi:hypothetical protein